MKPMRQSDESMAAFPLKTEYARATAALERTGILTRLPKLDKLGVLGIDGKEYPVPTQEQLQEVFTRNKALVREKMRQGFTQLQLTPLAMPIPRLIELAKTAIREHAAAGKIIRTKRQDSANNDMPVSVNADEPIWIWARVRKVIDTPALVYFPKAYTDRDHKGLTKEEVIRETGFLCAVPGWSMGLIEPMPIMPRPGQGKVLGGRKQLEGYSTPNEYLRALSTPHYQGETGWTQEDFLTYFMTQLEAENQVSHDRQDGNALWLLGSYIPDLLGGNRMKRLVATGYWARKRLYLSSHRAANRIKCCAARSMVRLGAS